MAKKRGESARASPKNSEKRTGKTSKVSAREKILGKLSSKKESKGKSKKTDTKKVAKVSTKTKSNNKEQDTDFDQLHQQISQLKKSFHIDKKEQKEEKSEDPGLEKSKNYTQKDTKPLKVFEEYDFTCDGIPIKIKIGTREGEFVPIYEISIANLSLNTEIVLESIKRELIKKVNLGMVDMLDQKNNEYVEQKFSETIYYLVTKYFPYSDKDTINFLTTYLIQKSLGMGKVEILMSDVKLEEIVINASSEPVWVYHRKHGWLKTNVFLQEEDQTKHYATMIARKIGRQINVLNPLLDANLSTGDRVNATLYPVSNFGNTITIRKFAAKPWTITDLINSGTMSYSAASLIWLGVQYELSTLISGGTGSGKTSTLNVISGFFPPNQRILSIEDTREIRLPKYLHWVPMMTRPANAEGKGGVSMENLLVNSLRQRPDRIIVGEIRRKREAEVLFEAMHTGHSTYATVHANTAEETVTRLTNPPIEVPKTMLPALSMVVVQFRNRRDNIRRTLQLAEITPDSEARVLMRYNMKKDSIDNVKSSKHIYNSIQMFTGFGEKEFKQDLQEKSKVLKYLVKQKINQVDNVGRIMAEYYTNKQNLMKYVNKNKKFI